MKATLTFDLPEEEPEHKYALAGLDALLLISALEDEIRSKLRYGSGEFNEFLHEKWDDESGEYAKEKVNGDNATLQKVWDWIINQKRIRNLPELI